jgi:UDP-N-acetylglucosamine 2-epimerase (non-hydrolysing)
MKIKFIFIFGTRPEAIKLAPLIQALKRESWAHAIVLNTGQHKELLDQVFDVFDIKIDFDLNIMTQDQTLSELSSKLLVSIDKIIFKEKPDMTVVQGDTSSAMIGSLASFYRKIPICHVEAGLRTYDLDNPFPEELNRVVISKLATIHFCPSQKSYKNLITEGISPSNIFITGNTGIDSLLTIIKTKTKTKTKTKLSFVLDVKKKLILVTVHRRENFGKPLMNICEALKEIAINNKKVIFLVPLHPNPNVRQIIKDNLSGVPNITLCNPLDYISFVIAMKHSYFILTDSGGVQEEAPALNKPVLILRRETERKEMIEEGVAKLIGSSKSRIIKEVQLLLSDKKLHSKMSKGSLLYGNGKASAKICDILKKSFNNLLI